MFSCNICDYSTPHKGDLKKHTMFHYSTKKFACGNCDSKFTTSSDLKRHERTHNKIKNLICSFQSCGFSTGRREHLLNHESTHTSIEARLNHPCNVCTKYFSSQSVLNRHRKTCSKPEKSTPSNKEVISTKCEICYKIFSSIYKLRQHEKNHSSELGIQAYFVLKRFK